MPRGAFLVISVRIHSPGRGTLPSQQGSRCPSIKNTGKKKIPVMQKELLLFQFSELEAEVGEVRKLLQVSFLIAEEARILPSICVFQHSGTFSLDLLLIVVSGKNIIKALSH